MSEVSSLEAGYANAERFAAASKIHAEHIVSHYKNFADNFRGDKTSNIIAASSVKPSSSKKRKRDSCSTPDDSKISAELDCISFKNYKEKIDLVSVTEFNEIEKLAAKLGGHERERYPEWNGLANFFFLNLYKASVAMLTASPGLTKFYYFSITTHSARASAVKILWSCSNIVMKLLTPFPRYYYNILFDMFVNMPQPLISAFQIIRKVVFLWLEEPIFFSKNRCSVTLLHIKTNLLTFSRTKKRWLLTMPLQQAP
jgi:hypothetical protein